MPAVFNIFVVKYNPVSQWTTTFYYAYLFELLLCCAYVNFHSWVGLQIFWVYNLVQKHQINAIFIGLQKVPSGYLRPKKKLMSVYFYCPHRCNSNSRWYHAVFISQNPMVIFLKVNLKVTRNHSSSKMSITEWANVGAISHWGFIQ